MRYARLQDVSDPVRKEFCNHAGRRQERFQIHTSRPIAPVASRLPVEKQALKKTLCFVQSFNAPFTFNLFGESLHQLIDAEAQRQEALSYLGDWERGEGR